MKKKEQLEAQNFSFWRSSGSYILLICTLEVFSVSPLSAKHIDDISWTPNFADKKKFIL